VSPLHFTHTHTHTHTHASPSANSYLNSLKIQLPCSRVFWSSGIQYSNTGSFTSLWSHLLESSVNVNQEKPGLMSSILGFIGCMVKPLLWGQAMFLSSAWLRNFHSDFYRLRDDKQAFHTVLQAHPEHALKGTWRRKEHYQDSWQQPWLLVSRVFPPIYLSTLGPSWSCIHP